MVLYGSVLYGSGVSAVETVHTLSLHEAILDDIPGNCMHSSYRG